MHRGLISSDCDEIIRQRYVAFCFVLSLWKQTLCVPVRYWIQFTWSLILTMAKCGREMLIVSTEFTHIYQVWPVRLKSKLIHEGIITCVHMVRVRRLHHDDISAHCHVWLPCGQWHNASNMSQCGRKLKSKATIWLRTQSPNSVMLNSVILSA